MPNLNLQEHGVEIKSGLISDELIQSVISEVDAFDEAMPKYGIRNAEKKFPSISNVINSQILLDEACKFLKKEPKIVRVIFFDKTIENNWLVAWHQDKTVTVNKKFDCDGWKPWSFKDKTHHVQPPVEVLNQMVTFRIHLDPADNKNGCLKVILGSHQHGILKQIQIDKIASKEEAFSCIVDTGDTVVMRPHILHASSKAIIPKHRRIIHVEFSDYDLPNNISWA